MEELIESGAAGSVRAAVIEGTREVFWPVVTSSLTTVAAFLPMLLMEGVVGEFMSVIPKTVIAVLAASLLECLFILPAHYLHFGSRKPQKGPRVQVTRILKWIEEKYTGVLPRLVRRPWVVVLIVLVATGGAAMSARTLPVELFPSDFQAFFCNVYADSEYGLEQTSEALKEVEAVVDEFMPEEVDDYTQSLAVPIEIHLGSIHAR